MRDCNGAQQEWEKTHTMLYTISIDIINYKLTQSQNNMTQQYRNVHLGKHGYTLSCTHTHRVRGRVGLVKPEHVMICCRGNRLHVSKAAVKWYRKKKGERKRDEKEDKKGKIVKEREKTAMCVVGSVIYHIEKWQMQNERGRTQSLICLMTTRGR